MVSRADIDSDGDPVRTGVNGRPEGPEALCEHHRRAPVEQPVRLTIALDGHASYDALGGGLDDLDTHAQMQFAVVEEVERYRWVLVRVLSHHATLGSPT